MRPETWRGDMRHETRDLAGLARQSLNVSLSYPVSKSQCLNVSASLLSQVSGLPLFPLPLIPLTNNQKPN